MKMTMEQYWPQHKVFFVATLALFPDTLKGAVMTLVFYRPYFAKDDVAVIELTLQEYQKLGYLKYKKLSASEFKIIEIDSVKATDDLVEYLEKWQSDKLSLLSAKKPVDTHRQQKLLHDALARTYQLDPNDTQRIVLEDIYGSQKSEDFGTPFWEPVLSLQLLDLTAKITLAGYDRSQSGLYKNNAQPYADIKITAQNLRRSLELIAKSSEPISDEDPEEFEYAGLLAARDGTITYKGVAIPFTRQEVDVMRVLLRRPEEMRVEEDFTNPYASIFNNAASLPDIHTTLSKLISRTRKKLESITGQRCITNTSGRGWTLKITPTE